MSNTNNHKAIISLFERLVRTWKSDGRWEIFLQQVKDKEAKSKVA